MHRCCLYVKFLSMCFFCFVEEVGYDIWGFWTRETEKHKADILLLQSVVFTVVSSCIDFTLKHHNRQETFSCLLDIIVGSWYTFMTIDLYVGNKFALLGLYSNVPMTKLSGSLVGSVTHWVTYIFQETADVCQSFSICDCTVTTSFLQLFSQRRHDTGDRGDLYIGLSLILAHHSITACTDCPRRLLLIPAQPVSLYLDPQEQDSSHSNYQSAFSNHK